MILTVGIGGYVYTHLDSEIQRYVQRKLAEHYRGLKVRVASARLIEGRGIEIRGVTIAEPRPDGARKLLEIDEIFVVCSPSLSDLLQDRFEVEQIVIRRPRLTVERRPENHWSVERLVPGPRFGDGRPVVVIEDAAVELLDPLARPPRKLALRDGNFRLEPQPPLKMESRDHWSRPARFAVKGTLGGDFVQRVRLQGEFDETGGTWQFAGVAEGVELGPELLAALPAPWVNDADPLRGLRGHAKITFELASDPTGRRPCRYHTLCQLTRGRIEDSRLPYPLTDVDAVVRCRDGVLSIERFTAWNGAAQLSLTCRRQGFADDAPLALTAKVRKLTVNHELAAALPPDLYQLWQDFLPRGEVDLDLQLNYDGGRWKTDLVARLDNVAFTYHKFPYPLHRASGTLTYRDDALQIDLRARADDRPLHILGRIVHPGPDATGWIELRGDELALNERLVTALPAEGRKALGALNPRGRFQVYWLGRRDQPRGKFHSHLELTLDRCAIRFDKFPYPLTNIRGSIEMNDGHWKFTQLEGANDSGFVTCDGELKPTARGPLLTLHFAGTEVPLEDELRDALNPAARRLWADLKPQGRIDLTADVAYLFDSRQLNLDVRVKPLGESASIEPAALPYRLEKLRGLIHYRDGVVTLRDVRAEHGDTRLATDGQCQMRPDGGWYLSLRNLTVDRLSADRELLAALPAGPRRVVSQLKLTGPVNLRGSFGLSQDALRGAPLKSRWDLAIALRRNAVDIGVTLSELHGEVRLTGAFDGRRLWSRGELSLDSLNYGTIQLTHVRGPLWIDNDRVLLGIWAQRQIDPDAAPRRVTARLYGGEVAGDGWATLAEPRRFALQASLRGADVRRFALEGLPGEQELNGTLAGDLELRGGRGAHSLAGSGNIRLRDADLYELPLVVQLLKVLRVRLPDKTAFTQSNMYFRIDGEHVYFDKLDLLGDAVSLYGKGEVNFNHELQLTFHSVVGRNDLPIPLLRNLVGKASQQLMQVHVRGTLEDPRVINEPLPVVNQALQQLEAGLAPPRAAAQPRNRPHAPAAPLHR